jgi:hypothetical protein
LCSWIIGGLSCAVMRGGDGEWRESVLCKRRVTVGQLQILCDEGMSGE